MKCSKEKEMGYKSIYKENEKKNLLQYTLAEQISHGMDVSNLVYTLTKELDYPEDICYNMAIAGILHDIGKVVLKDMIDDKNSLMVEEMKVVRMHPSTGYEITKNRGYNDLITESILGHHENYDGSGYPRNLKGEEIPFGARILRICDVYCALTSDRPYRAAYSEKEAFQMLIEQSKDFDLKFFLAFQRIIHKYKRKSMRVGNLHINERGELL